MKNLKLKFEEPKKFDPLVIDVETQMLSSEVQGGWNAIDKFKVSVAVSWDLGNNMRVWYEEDVARLIEESKRHYPIITFNGEGFDFKVLSAYGNVESLYQSSVDLLKITKTILGHRVFLESIATATLGKPKTATGLEAVEWWRSGDPVLRQRVVDYCKEDVAITRDIYYHAKDKGHLICTDLSGGQIKYNVPKSVLGVTE